MQQSWRPWRLTIALLELRFKALTVTAPVYSEIRAAWRVFMQIHTNYLALSIEWAN